MIECMKKNRKELLLPFLCFVLGLLLAIASIQVQEQEVMRMEKELDSIPIGIAFLISYFVGRRMLAKEMEAEEQLLVMQAENK